MRAIKKRGGEKTNFLLLLFLLTISTIQWQISLFVRVFEDASTSILYSYFPKLIEIIEIVIGQSIFSDLNFAFTYRQIANFPRYVNFDVNLFSKINVKIVD